MTDNIQQLAAEVRGDFLSDKDKALLISEVSRVLGSVSTLGGSTDLIRGISVNALMEKHNISLTLATYIFDEAVSKAASVRVNKVAPVMKEHVEKMKTEVELAAWPFTIVKATSIGDTLRLTLEIDSELVPLTMEVKDLYNQQRFREQFTSATGKILGRVKAKTFEAFIANIDIQQIKDTGTSTKDLVVDALTRLYSRVLEAKTEEEIDEAMKTKAMCRFGDALRFKISKIKNEMELKGIKPERLAQCLEDIGAEKISRGVWTWKKP